MSRKGDDGAIGCLAVMILGIFVMPFFGAYLIKNGRTDEEQIMGYVVAFVGLILWLVVFIGSQCY